MEDNIQVNDAPQSAEQTTPEVNQTQVQPQATPQIEISDELVDKLINQLQGRIKGVGKGMIKDEGIKGQEAAQLLDTVQERLTNSKRVQDLEEKIDALLKEQEATKTAAKQEALDMSIEMVSKELGLDENVRELVKNNVDLNDVFDDKGKVKKGDVSKKFNEFLDKFPSLKPQPKETTNPFVVKGGSGESSDDGAKQTLKFNFREIQ